MWDASETTHRWLISSPWGAYAPQLRVDLNAQRALGSILDHHAWWAASPRERGQWILDLEASLVHMNLVQVLSVWDEDKAPNWGFLTQRALDTAMLPMGSNERHTAIDSVFVEMVDKIQSRGYFWTHIPSSSGSEDESKSESEDDGEDDTEEPSGDHEENPFGQVAWVMSVVVMRERLLALASHEATLEEITCILRAGPSRDNATTLARTRSLLRVVLAAAPEATTTTLASLLPNCLPVDALGVLCWCVSAIRKLIQSTTRVVAHALEVLVRQVQVEANTTGDASTHIAVPGPATLTWMRQLPTSAFGSELAALREAIAHERDVDRDDPVVRLVDPSLYCIVEDRTTYRPSALNAPFEYETPAQHLHMLLSSPADSLATVSHIGQRPPDFRWLPCEIQVDNETGTASIRSYINNLHPVTYVNLYVSIERIFSHFVPLFENVLTSLASEPAPNPSVDYLLRVDPLEISVALGEPRVSLRGTQCQVVVRLTEIQLTPETTPAFLGEPWHCEGCEDIEQIVATGVYFFSAQNITTTRLALRRFVAFPDHNEEFIGDTTLGLAYGLLVADVLAQALGTMTVVEGGCVVFPNVYQSRLEPFQLRDPKKPGMLGMLTFMLVAPTVDPILSTACVPPQQSHWIQQERDLLLRQFHLPETLEMLVREFAREGMTMDEALQYRHELNQYLLPPVEDSDHVWYHQGFPC